MTEVYTELLQEMTEEIIIDGVDVSEWDLKGVLIPITECKYFEGIGGCKETRGLCVANDNCYYKQLKRLEQENKQIKSALEEIREIAYGGADVNDCSFCHNIYNKINEVLK